MLYELVSEADFEGFPEEPELKFVAFERTCRASMTRLITQDTSSSADTFVRMQYMAEVAGAAETLGIRGVEYPAALDDPVDSLNWFMLSVSRATSNIKLRSLGGSRTYSVRLGQKTRGRIEQQIQALRGIISSESMPEGKRSKLLKLLNDLSLELSQPRVSFKKVMAVLAQVSLGVATGTSFLANAPHAIATIHSLLGADKEAEEAEAQRLGEPPVSKALPGFGRLPQKPQAIPDRSEPSGRMTEIIDDDIPF